jgi:hypothetical protein
MLININKNENMLVHGGFLAAFESVRFRVRVRVRVRLPGRL